MKKIKWIPLAFFGMLLASLYGTYKMSRVKSLALQEYREENQGLLGNEEAYSAYFPILLSEREAIKAYDWGEEKKGKGKSAGKKGTDTDQKSSADVKEKEAVKSTVSFTDVTGDGIEELIYLKAGQAEEDKENAILSIYSYYDGRVKKLTESFGWDEKEQEDSFCLYKLKGKAGLYYYYKDRDEEYYGQLTSSILLDGQDYANEDWIRKNEDYSELLFSHLEEKNSPLYRYEKMNPDNSMGIEEALEYIQKMNPSLKIPEEKKEEKTRDDWSRAFYQYVMEEGQQLNVLSDTDNPVMALWDMDGDKIPELIIGTNDTYGSYSSAKVVKYSNQGMKVLEGNLDSYGTIFGANHTADPDYPGVYFHYWRRGDYVDAAGGQDMEGAMHYYIIYSYIDGEALKDIEVASYTENDLYYYRDKDEVIQYNQLTEDRGLFDATTVNPSRGIQFVTLEEIQEMGWENFADLNSIDTSDYYEEYSDVFHKAKILIKSPEEEELDLKKLLTQEDVEQHLGSFVMKASVPLSFYWSTKSFFEKSNTEYNADYAKMAAVFSEAANTGKKEIEDCYKGLRFGKISTYEGNYVSHSKCRASFATAKYDYRDSEEDPLEERIIFMISLGSNEPEYHFPYDYQAMRQEIQRDSRSIYQEFLEFYQENVRRNSYAMVEPEKTYALFITGEGQNGAVAEQLGKIFLENDWDRSSVTVYAFNTPNYTAEHSDDEWLPIFNIVNKGDLSVQYTTGYQRYGRSFYFKGNEDSIAENHDFVRMMQNLSTDTPKENKGKGNREKTYQLIPITGEPKLDVLDASGLPMAGLSEAGVQYRKSSPVQIFRDGDKSYVIAPSHLHFSLYLKGKKEEKLYFQVQRIEKGKLLEQSSFDNIVMDKNKRLFTEIRPEAKTQNKLYILRDKLPHSLESLFYGKERELAVRQIRPHGEITGFFHISVASIVFIVLSLCSFLLLLLSLRDTGKSKQHRIQEKT